MATGKRAGSRRGARPRPKLNPVALGIAAGITLCVVAWGYLVYAAIDFGTAARGGESMAWVFLGLASLGAIACLFTGLMLAAWMLRALGITSTPPPAGGDLPVGGAPPRAAGGKRAAR